MTCWVDGRLRGRIDGRDRGLNYGDGAFETMRVRRRRVRLLGYHLQRLEATCRRLKIDAPDAKNLVREIERIAARHAEAVVKLVLTRGVGERGYRPTGRERCTRVITLHPLPRTRPESAPLPAPPPARARLCALRLGVNPALAGLKTLNRLESVLARAEWTDERIWEGLIRDSDDNIVCGTMSNLFLRSGVTLVTPLLDRCGIAGVMRRWVLEESSRMRLSACERRVRLADLAAADEVFMTNAVVGVVPLRFVQLGRTGLRFSDFGASRELHRRLEAL